MGFTHNKLYRVLVFFFPKSGRGRMIHFRGIGLLHFLAFLKKQLFKLLHFISKYYFKTVCKYQPGIPKLWYPSSRLPKLLKKAWELLLPCCTINPQPRLTLHQLLHEALYSYNSWKPDYQIMADSPDFHHQFYSKITNLKMWSFFWEAGQKPLLEQVEIGHHNFLVGMWQYHKDLQDVHGVCAIERGNGFLQNACQIQVEQDPCYVLLW